MSADPIVKSCALANSNAREPCAALRLGLSMRTEAMDALRDVAKDSAVVGELFTVHVPPARM